ncbi:Crp/Fnr family transcriptional regulator [Dethiobacter alkaliphilus]|uniref:Crp/Fnr family transcriptional regulator n=1 Tax=Dethiobacter alkaliphilus TaxID=427926 RepID=UPI0022261754|nr:Crp/Fnr family transcriptional regulator [Dethiobacter alkaliphilus]MCW3489249.1 Crp/Fnr family transcriptional regulator [Dethiobacter alkaliphilus]
MSSSCSRCCDEKCASKVPIFFGLSQEDLKRVVSLIVRKEYEKDEILVLKGSNLEGLIIVSKGRVKAFRDTLEGREQILYIFSEGDFFGEKNLLQNRDVTYTVQALEKTHICMIKKVDFHQLFRTNPDIGLKVLQELCNRLYHLENALESIGSRSVEARINSVLLDFAHKFGQTHPQGIMIELPLSREGIANYIGLTRETVSRKMSLLQEEGIIKMVGHKKVIILNKEALDQPVI